MGQYKLGTRPLQSAKQQFPQASQEEMEMEMEMQERMGREEGGKIERWQLETSP